MSMRNPSGFVRPGYNPLKVADAPTGVVPTPDNVSASVDFTPPSNVGGAAVSEYYAVVQPGNITATSVTPPVAVSGLTNGVEYTTKVWANNAYGPSPYSPQSSGFIPQLLIYVEDVFSTYLYTGNGSTQTITNGIDLDGEGGMVWLKSRSLAEANIVVDSARGPTFRIGTNSTVAQADNSAMVSAFTSNGFSLGDSNVTNTNASTNVSWTFRKAPKFFDVVTYTGDGTTGRNISHNLGSVPGCVIVKRIDSSAAGDWTVYHRSSTANTFFYLNTTLAAQSGGEYVFGDNSNIIIPTDTVFTVSAGAGYANVTSATYVAYLFAHDAGGFGDDGQQNVISCGSFTYDGVSEATIDLGWEPQWVLLKKVSGNGNWNIADNMRGFSQSSVSFLYPNLSNAEDVVNGAPYWTPTATGFSTSGYFSSGTYIYIAIRRGPMQTPESGTEVFSPVVISSPTSTQTVTTNFPVDMTWSNEKAATSYGTFAIDRLRSNSITSNRLLQTTSGNAEGVNSWGGISFQSNTSIIDSVWNYLGGGSSTPVIYWNFRRAPGFMDVVAYTGTGVAKTVAHGLGAVPELMIVKERNNTGGWQTYTTTTGNTKYFYVNSTAAAAVASAVWNDTSPTASVFTVGTGGEVNEAGSTYVAYLFATLAGVSKVGSYTGTGADLNVDCGFSAGARFILIKRTDSTGDWYVWDSARGIVAGNDPYLLLNSTAAEITNTDYVDTLASGFTVTSSAPAALNASGGSYIFLAIA